jgi:hypothetical protein
MIRMIWVIATILSALFSTPVAAKKCSAGSCEVECGGNKGCGCIADSDNPDNCNCYCFGEDVGTGCTLKPNAKVDVSISGPTPL